ncbi:integrase, catalytic region, zinc finger, CCHC-type containing protein [Tanacetum coccineum]
MTNRPKPRLSQCYHDGDYLIGDSVISTVYYVEGLGHNLFSVRKFCDSDLEVAFRKHACYVRDTDGVKLIKGSCGSNLYTISVEDMMKSSSICLLSKASKNKSWLWHRRLNHLSFSTINDLARKALSSRGLHLRIRATSLMLSGRQSFAPVDNDSFINVFALEPSYEASSSGDLSLVESSYVTQTLHHLDKWSKDHPLDNIISNPSRQVSTRKQLATYALWVLRIHHSRIIYEKVRDNPTHKQYTQIYVSLSQQLST